jgi:hypothetical protein
MTKSFYKSHTTKFFVGKQAIMLDQVWWKGEYVIKNELVTILRKKKGFAVKNSGKIVIERVPYFKINLYE